MSAAANVPALTPALPSALATTLATEALAFAPDLLAIQERPPERLPRVLLLCVVALVALLILWATFAQLDIIATAEGRLVPVGYTKLVQPADAGIVSEILVKDGERVQVGQVLLRLDPRLSQADVEGLKNEVGLKRLTIARVDAELSNKPFKAGDAPALLAAQLERQFRSRRQAYADTLAQENEALNKARADLRVAQQVRAKLTQTLPSYQQSAESYRKLVHEGFVGELAAVEKQRELAERTHDLATQIASIDSLEASIAQSQRRMSSLESQYRSQLDNERVEAMTLLNRAEQELQKSRVRSTMLEIRSPISGIVKDFAVTTQGAVVASGALLMNIVPVDGQLQAEVLLKNADMGFVAMAQKVRLKVAAYPFQKYGLIDGQVTMISADATEPKPGAAAPSQPMTYRAFVRLDTSRLHSAASGKPLALNAGMLVMAEIHQGKRTVLEYLLSPVRTMTHEAARER